MDVIKPLEQKARGATGRPWLAFFSPHPDDCAFSSIGVLEYAKRTHEVVLVTVFSTSRYAPALACPGSDVSCLRQVEDAAFAKASEFHFVSLGFPDSHSRGYTDDTECLVDESEGVCGDAVAKEVDRGIARAIGIWRPQVVVAPLGIGAHVDHVLVKNAVRKHTPSDVKVLFYEDLPYAAEAPAHLVRDLGYAVGVPREIFLTEDWLTTKLNRLQLYRSQVTVADLVNVARYARNAAGQLAEVVWEKCMCDSEGQSALIPDWAGDCSRFSSST